MTVEWWTILFLLLSPVLKEDSMQTDLEISHRARSLQPGEVVLVRSVSPVPLKELSGEAFGTTFPFYPSSDRKVWEGLIGIDLETEPGVYSVDLNGATLEEVSVSARYDLEIQPKEFPTRRLTVPQQYVTPPREALERIRRESRKISEIFATFNPEKLWSGVFLAPVPGAPTSGFGKRSILNGQPRSPHTGTDFDAETGTPVRAPNKGKVLLATNLYYSGNTVILDHGQGLYSYFGHLSKFAVEQADVVSTGDLIGYVGATGRVTGPHLHWTVRLNQMRVDPLSLMAVLTKEEE